MTEVIEAALRTACWETLGRIVIDPGTAVLGVDVTRLATPRFDTFEPRGCYLVTVATTDSSMVSGSVAGYKGSYKERLEGALELVAKRFDPGIDVAVDITGPAGRTVEKMVPLALASRMGVAGDSPILATAQALDIPFVLIRGRHLIGPNPALPRVVQRFAEGSIATALELFAGTGAATKLIARRFSAASVTAVEIDDNKVAALVRHLGELRNVTVTVGDALRYPFRGVYDLIVADPYYEDTVAFLEARGAELASSAGCLVLLGGRIEHVSWNRRIADALGSRWRCVARHDYFGQVVFIATHSESLMPSAHVSSA